MSKFEYMEFREGGCNGITDIVGRKSLFKNEQDFADFANTEFGIDAETSSAENVKTAYIRYYPKMPEGFEIESGYAFCNKGRGAIEVYRLEV
jgi:hypothetical protein